MSHLSPHKEGFGLIRKFVIRNFVIRNFVIRQFVIRNFVPGPVNLNEKKTRFDLCNAMIIPMQFCL